MYKLGITGGMGAGKSTAAKYFQDQGAEVFDADEEAKILLRETIDLQLRIIDTFGSKVTTKNNLDLNKLSEIVFSSRNEQQKLNQIIWPTIFLLIINAATKAENYDKKLFIVDAALLIEANFTSFFNSILLIKAPKSIRYERVLSRKNIPKHQIEKRIALQIPDKEKEKVAQTTIANNGSLHDFINKLETFYEQLVI